MPMVRASERRHHDRYAVVAELDVDLSTHVAPSSLDSRNDSTSNVSPAHRPAAPRWTTNLGSRKGGQVCSIPPTKRLPGSLKAAGAIDERSPIVSSFPTKVSLDGRHRPGHRLRLGRAGRGAGTGEAGERVLMHGRAASAWRNRGRHTASGRPCRPTPCVVSRHATGAAMAKRWTGPERTGSDRTC